MDSAPCVLYEKGLVVFRYVADLLKFFDDESETRKFGTSLGKMFVTEDLGHPKQFLEIEIICDDDETIGLRHSNSTTNFISKYGKEQGRRALCPMSLSENVTSDTEFLNEKLAKNYCIIEGSLHYIAIKTRSDIATSASVLRTYVSCPQPKNYISAQRLLRYLRGTEQYALCFKTIPKGKKSTAGIF